MGTRALIGKLDADNNITAIYCHWDGYPEYTGVILNECYKNIEKIDALLNLGNISSLGVNVGTTPIDFNSTFDDVKDSICIAYHRDRGEDLDILKCKDADLIYYMKYYEYTYIYNTVNSKWYMYTTSKAKRELNTVIKRRINTGHKLAIKIYNALHVE